MRAGFTVLVFVQAEVLVDAAFSAAAAGLTRLAGGGWLAEASEGAYESSLVGLARVGPFGDVRGMSKLVQVYARDVQIRDGRAVLTLRWEATGPTGGLFPALDADITLTPAGDGQSRLTLDGAYRPPFAALGASLDKLVLHRVATPTAKSLLSQLAAAVTAAMAAEPDGATRPAT